LNIKKMIAATMILGMLGMATASATGILPTDALKLPEWDVISSSYGGKLLLSDSPEMVYGDGIMYRDSVVGNARLFFHHVNATQTDKRIVAILENEEDRPAEVIVHRYGLGGPNKDWIQVGKDAEVAYMDGGPLYIINIPPRGKALLSQKLGESVVKPDMLVNGIYDFMTNRMVRVSTMMMPVDVKPEAFAGQAKVLAADEYRLRGTFDGCERLLIGAKLYDGDTDGAVAVTLADNNIDKYVSGIDATDGSKVCNYGNYGIVYHIFLPTTEGKPLSYSINPRGGTYAGAIGLKYRHANLPSVQTPDDKLFMGTATEAEYSEIGKFPGGDSLWLTFSPPGASNLPVKLIISPE